LSAPTALSPERANTVLPYINSITLSGQTLRYPVISIGNSTVTAEEKAVQWLIEEDTNSTSLRAMRQRYVLATVWYQNGIVAALDTWASSSRPECEWRHTICVNGDVTALRLQGSERTGPMTSDLGLLTNLTDLIWGTTTTATGSNGPVLTGTIPSSLGLLTRLTRLNVQYNQLTGRIPTSFAALTALNALVLADNQLSGPIPSSLASNLTALTRLFLHNNKLSGKMPFCSNNTVDASRFTALDADCNEVACPCCTACCPASGWNGIPGRLDGCDALKDNVFSCSEVQNKLKCD
jgi:Leucine rich repeat